MLRRCQNAACRRRLIPPASRRRALPGPGPALRPALRPAFFCLALCLTLLAGCASTGRPVSGGPNPAPLEPTAANPDSGGLGLAAHFFPLLYHAPDDGLGVTETSALWPFLLAQDDRATTDHLRALHPLISWGRAENGYQKYFDILYPFIGARTEQLDPGGDYTHRRWLLPVYYHKHGLEDGYYHSRDVLFPFIYAGRKGEFSLTRPAPGYFIFFPFFWHIDPGARFFFPLFTPDPGPSRAYWPLFGTFRNAFGSDETSFVLWPLYIRSRAGTDQDVMLLWPIFQRMWGPEVSGWRVWPLYSWRKRDGLGTRVTFLWPLGWHIRRQAAPGRQSIKFDAFLPLWFDGEFGGDALQIEYYFPVWGQVRKPRKTTTSWFWPVYMHTRHIDPDWTQHRWFWWLINFKRSAAQNKSVVFPFYGRTTEPDARDDRFFLYPFVHSRKETKSGGDVFKRDYVVPLWSNQRWYDAEGNLEQRRQGLTPLYRWVQRFDGSREFSFPHLWFGTDLEGWQRNWAPLYTLYQWRDDGRGTTERRYLWRLWRTRTVTSENGEQLREREINFLLGRWHKSLTGDVKLTILGLEIDL